MRKKCNNFAIFHSLAHLRKIFFYHFHHAENMKIRREENLIFFYLINSFKVFSLCAKESRWVFLRLLAYSLDILLPLLVQRYRCVEALPRVHRWVIKSSFVRHHLKLFAFALRTSQHFFLALFSSVFSSRQKQSMELTKRQLAEREKLLKTIIWLT